MLGIAVWLVVGAIRHTGQSPADWVGIGMFGVTIIAFLTAAITFYFQFLKSRIKKG